ncbi:MAG: hypothetical protein KAS32_08965 [Candidatus Peribacteraceae bacterium]|nr:hypothetical protein [Candidatus Peribacteraceae bacterium]
MKNWEQRPAEIANLLNPPFCAEVIRNSIYSYDKESNLQIPYPLLYLILPIVLHKKTRDLIKPRSRMNTWLLNNQHLRIGFAKRAESLVPISTEAIIFLFHTNSIIIDGEARLKVTHETFDYSLCDEEVLDCFKKAGILGKWFSNAGSPASIYTMWGVQP